MDEFRETQRAEDEQDGSEGGPAPENENADTPPALPSSDDDSPLGDTDQHSDADA
jgi:hypothetical protein